MFADITYFSVSIYLSIFVQFQGIPSFFGSLILYIMFSCLCMMFILLSLYPVVCNNISLKMNSLFDKKNWNFLAKLYQVIAVFGILRSRAFGATHDLILSRYFSWFDKKIEISLIKQKTEQPLIWSRSKALILKIVWLVKYFIPNYWFFMFSGWDYWLFRYFWCLLQVLVEIFYDDIFLQSLQK